MEDNTETLTVMFVDIVSYTKTTSQLSREEVNRLHDIFDDLAIPIFERHNGQIIKKMGDDFLVAFKSPTNAVLCGMEIQDAFYEYNRGNPQKPLRVRVAIHTGEVIKRKNDIYGEAVNVAARMEDITPPNQIFFSEAVFSAMNKQEIPFSHLGLKRFRGLKYPVRIFKAKSNYRIRKQARTSVLGELIRILVAVGIIGLAIYLIYFLLSNFT
ncbi:MAG: adenylate/guanylate cyclase domain-containing protein [Candidatus Pacebacteria bacterium]|nr:adenylate/guanylate cyclase domain-containing protein [Candidatus Paceibacterota bacterium]